MTCVRPRVHLNNIRLSSMKHVIFCCSGYTFPFRSICRYFGRLVGMLKKHSKAFTCTYLLHSSVLHVLYGCSFHIKGDSLLEKLKYCWHCTLLLCNHGPCFNSGNFVTVYCLTVFVQGFNDYSVTIYQDMKEKLKAFFLSRGSMMLVLLKTYLN